MTMAIRDGFSGKTALVTGAASGIGLEIATCLSRAGAHVCVLDVNREQAQHAAKTLGSALGKAGAIVGSVSEPSISEAIRAYPPEHGRRHFDLLVNAAAISPKNADGLRYSAWQTSPLQWNEVIQVNLNGVFHTMHAVLPAMIDSGAGAIVNISSLAGRRYSSIAGAAYATSKAAVEAMTRQFAGEVAEFGVRINAVSPGRIQTPMAAQAGDEFNENIRLQTPLRRLGMPRDVANAVLFLLSDEANFTTGETLVVSGGRGL